MAKQRKLPLKPIVGLVGASVVIGLGASVVEKSGGSAAGLSTVSSFMPIVGTAIGSYMVVGQLKNLQKVSKKRRR